MLSILRRNHDTNNTMMAEKAVANYTHMAQGVRTGFVEKGLRPLQPVYSGSFPPAPPLAIATLPLHILLMGAWEVILASHAPKR